MPREESDLALLIRSVAFAAQKHRDQLRRDGHTPYINHPVAVANILADVGKVDDVEVLVAAVLHDTIEDTETTADELRTAFGDRILGLVLECTDNKDLPKEERKRLQVDEAAHKSNGAKLIKIADKISNIRDLTLTPPTDWTLDRKAKYVQWSDAVFQGLKGVNAELDKLFQETRDQAARHFSDGTSV